jgi:nucleotide-binding universal stress UspA family protein
MVHPWQNGTAIAPCCGTPIKTIVMNKGKILIPVRFNEQYQDYIGYGVKMASDFDKDILMLHVFNSESYPFTPVAPGEADILYVQENIEQHEAESEEKLKSLIREIKEKENSPPHMEYRIVKGSELAEIGNISAHENIEMLVIGNHNSGGMFSVSPSTNDIINQADCPVWIIPDDTQYKPFKNILYSTDYQNEDIETVKKIVDLFRKTNPTISLLHVTNDMDFKEKVQSEGFMKLLNKHTGYGNIEITALENKDKASTSDLISEFAQEKNAELVVLLKENRHFLDRIFKSGTTKKLAKNTDFPVLVYHESRLSA